MLAFSTPVSATSLSGLLPAFPVLSFVTNPLAASLEGWAPVDSWLAHEPGTRVLLDRREAEANCGNFPKAQAMALPGFECGWVRF